MLSSSSSSVVKKVAILGGGISGLVSAWTLLKDAPFPLKICLFEKTERLGGWIFTKEEEGFFFEQGPRTLRTHGKGSQTLLLIQELGLESQVLLGDRHSRYLYLGGGLKKIPSLIRDLFFSPWVLPYLPSLF